MPAGNVHRRRAGAKNERPAIYGGPRVTLFLCPLFKGLSGDSYRRLGVSLVFWFLPGGVSSIVSSSLSDSLFQVATLIKL